MATAISQKRTLPCLMMTPEERENERRTALRNMRTIEQEEYITDVIGDDWWSNTPLHYLREDDELGHLYPDVKAGHFSKNIHETDGVRWTYGDQWYEFFAKPHHPEHRLPGLVHRVNSENMNGPEFVRNPAVLAMGCSVTSGIGLADDFAWPSIIRNETSNTVNNIGTPGASPAQCVYMAFAHIRKWGNPGGIYFLVPPLDRYWGPIKTTRKDGAIRSEIWPMGGRHYFPELQQYVWHSDGGGGTKPYRHHSIDGNKTLLPVDVVAHHNLMMLETLMMFCEANGIEMRISSWCRRTHMHLTLIGYRQLVQIPEFLRRYGEQYMHEPDEYNEWGSPHEMGPMGSRKNCCDREPQNPWQDRMWDHGLDIKHDRFYPHPGLHYQMHFAELFLGRQISNEKLANIRPWHEGTSLEPDD